MGHSSTGVLLRRLACRLFPVRLRKLHSTHPHLHSKGGRFIWAFRSHPQESTICAGPGAAQEHQRGGVQVLATVQAGVGQGCNATALFRAGDIGRDGAQCAIDITAANNSVAMNAQTELFAELEAFGCNDSDVTVSINATVEVRLWVPPTRCPWTRRMPDRCDETTCWPADTMLALLLQLAH